MNLEEFKKQAAEDGVWAISEASETMKAFTLKYHKDNYEEEIKKSETPRKYIFTEDKIIVVSLTEASWGGIKIFNKEDVIFMEVDDQIRILLLNKKGTRLISISDYQEEGEEEVLYKEDDFEIKTSKRHTKDAFYKDLMASGYIREEELNIKDINTRITYLR